jgi:hypothetical protein
LTRYSTPSWWGDGSYAEWQEIRANLGTDQDELRECFEKPHWSELPVVTHPVNYDRLGDNGNFQVNWATTSHGTMDFEKLPEELQEQARQLVVADIARKNREQER